MYEQYWGLREKPFQNTPDPKFFYYSQEHEEALSRLVYAIEEQMGAAMLTGAFGCGKTRIEEILRNNYDDGKNTVLIIDEAHVITEKAIFEELRLLLNFQLKDKFLLTLILSGQAELKKSVDSIKQLSQRIVLRSHIDKLSEEDTKNYMIHRLKVAGQEKALFSPDAVKLIYERSGGIPRRINNICEISLFTGFGKGVDIIRGEIIEEVTKDLEA